MTDFNPLVGALLGSPQAQQMNLSKQSQLRRKQAARKNVATDDESAEHQVESSEEIAPIHDGEQKQSPDRRKRQNQTPDDSDTGPSHIDITA
jgi:hypothetical protein